LQQKLLILYLASILLVIHSDIEFKNRTVRFATARPVQSIAFVIDSLHPPAQTESLL